METQKSKVNGREGSDALSLGSLAMPIAGTMSIDELRAALNEAERLGVTRVSLHAEFTFTATEAAKKLEVTLPEMSEHWRESCRRYENAKGADASWVDYSQDMHPDDIVTSEMIRNILTVMSDKTGKRLT